MYEIYATDMEFEQCAANKERIKIMVPYTVIHYVLSGSGTINGQKIGEGFAFASSMNSFMDYYPDADDPWSYIYIRLYGDGVKKAFSEAGFEEGMSVMNFTKFEELKNLLALYKSVCASKNEEGAKLIANLLFMLHKEKNEEPSSESMQEKNVRTVKNYIDNNYYKKITVTDISDKFHLSKNYVRNLFVKYLGVSPKKYIQKKRMDRAKTLLLETDISISTVALSVGYDDALLFSKMFLKEFSRSPQKYRQHNRNAQSNNTDFIKDE